VGVSEDGVAGPATLKALGVWADVIPGVDVSSYQTVDWSEVSRDEVQFAFVKASEGATWQDPRFIDHVRGARGAGLQAGAYHFARLTNDPWSEVDNFLTQVALAGPMDLPCVLDFEKDALDNPLQWLLCFLRQVEAETGVTPMLYTGVWRLRSMSGDTSQLTRFPYWVPSWGAQPVDCGPYSSWNCWQYTNKGRVSGIDGDVDMNWLVVQG
jgi:GH25 family lysozyme M1 (1,4-beta-N-acetylmuramidase)